ncbi:hypothetical protein HDV01_006458 [Terramyces sp. JEL0728]|nr:hypothetical protein HDV01_006458 [Terramyces sp. JEL0728]
MNIFFLLGLVLAASNPTPAAAATTVAPPPATVNPPANPTTQAPPPNNPTNPPNVVTQTNNAPVTTLAPIVVTSNGIVSTVIDGKSTYIEVTYTYTIIPTATGNSTSSDSSSSGGISDGTKILLIVFAVVFVVIVVGIYLFRTYGVRSSDAFKNRLNSNYDSYSSRSAENVTGGPVRPSYASNNNSGSRQYVTESVTGPARPRGSPYQDSGVAVYRLNEEPTLPDLSKVPYYPSQQTSPNRQQFLNQDPYGSYYEEERFSPNQGDRYGSNQSSPHM